MFVSNSHHLYMTTEIVKVYWTNQMHTVKFRFCLAESLSAIRFIMKQTYEQETLLPRED